MQESGAKNDWGEKKKGRRRIPAAAYERSESSGRGSSVPLDIEVVQRHAGLVIDIGEDHRAAVGEGELHVA